jgi:hypothetical protein
MMKSNNEERRLVAYAKKHSTLPFTAQSEAPADTIAGASGWAVNHCGQNAIRSTAVSNYSHRYDFVTTRDAAEFTMAAINSR